MTDQNLPEGHPKHPSIRHADFDMETYAKTLENEQVVEDREKKRELYLKRNNAKASPKKKPHGRAR